MVQKSGVHQLRLVVYPIIDKVLAPSQVVVRISPFSDLMCFFVPISSSYFPLASWMGTHPWRTWKKTMHTVYKYSRKKARSGPRKHREFCWDVGVVSIFMTKLITKLITNIWTMDLDTPFWDHGSPCFTKEFIYRTIKFEVTSSPDLLFPHLQAPMHGSLCFSSWGGLAGCFSVFSDGGSGVKTKKGICTWLLQTIIYHNLEKKTFLRLHDIFFSCIFFVQKTCCPPWFLFGSLKSRCRLSTPTQYQSGSS